jgi:tripartite-type tricarboxylate transporter receptor subunit TctC
LIVGFAAGGPTDIAARLIGQWLTERLGQSFVIENRPGAASNIATEAVIRAPTDGHTLLQATVSNAINASLYERLSFNFVRDTQPVAGLYSGPLIMEVSPAFPANSVSEFITHVRANRGQVNMASAGNGSMPHIAGELFKMMTGINMLHVPYRGAAPAMTDLLAGQVQLKMDTYATASQHVAAGKLRALAYAARARSEQLPDVPTVAEMGLPGYQGVLWMGIVAPAGMPPPVIEKLAAAVKRAVGTPELAERLKRDGIDPVGSGPQEFGAQITKEVAQWRELAKSVNIKLD